MPIGFLIIDLCLSTAVPKILQELPRQITIMKGNRTLLVCEGEASTMPLVTWFKNGQPLKKMGRVTITESRGNTSHSVQSTLRITNTEYTDAGVYKCVFNATGATVFSSGTVMVQGMYAKFDRKSVFSFDLEKLAHYMCAFFVSPANAEEK